MTSPPPAEHAHELVGAFVEQATDLTVRFLSDRVDFSPTAAFALNRVSREGPIRLTTLAAKEGATQPSMTQLMQRLERADLVHRLPDPDDGRACLIGITEHGQSKLDRRRDNRRERLSDMMAALSPEERSALQLAAHVALPILEKLVANADDITNSAAAQTE